MIVESIAALIEQYLIVRHNHYELVAFLAILHYTVIISSFQQRNYVQNAPVVKPCGSKPGGVHLHPGDPCSCIAVDKKNHPLSLRM